jgi:hypothetical protein
MNTVIQKSPAPSVPGYALTTATGSRAGMWYGSYRLVNDDVETLYTFYDESFPAPAFRTIYTPDGDRTDALVYDPLMLTHKESREYDPDRVVLVSAERAWLRDLRRKRKAMAKAGY